MTENEFLRLKIGTVVSVRSVGSKEKRYFVIYDTDQMGSAYRGQKYTVYGAKELDCEGSYTRIDRRNCKDWEIAGMIFEKPQEK